MAALIDLEILEETEDEVRARVPVTDALRQPLGPRARRRLRDDRRRAHRRAAAARSPTRRASCARSPAGTIHATARRRHNGRTTAVWEVDITDDAGRLCALVRTTIYPGP